MKKKRPSTHRRAWIKYRCCCFFSSKCWSNRTLQHWLPRDINKVVVYIRRGSIEVFVSMYNVHGLYECGAVYCDDIASLSKWFQCVLSSKSNSKTAILFVWNGSGWIGWAKLGSARLGLAGRCYSCFDKWTMTQRLVSMYAWFCDFHSDCTL